MYNVHIFIGSLRSTLQVKKISQADYTCTLRIILYNDDYALGWSCMQNSPFENYAPDIGAYKTTVAALLSAHL